MTLVRADEARRLVESIDRLLEADLRRRKARHTRPLERALERRLADIFRRQGAAFLRRLGALRSTYTPIVPRETSTVTEALRVEDWGPLFDQTTLETIAILEGTLTEFASLALLEGGRTAIAEFGIDGSFDLTNPRAVAYLEAHPALRVAGINAVTRDEIGRIITAGVEAGASYARIAREVRLAYAEFSVRRAKLIAVTEIGDAYEAGNRGVADMLTAVGLEVEKQWLDVGDRRVDPECVSNAAQGWIPIDATFASGHQQPTAHPGCRCTTEYRRKGSAFV